MHRDLAEASNVVPSRMQAPPLPARNPQCTGARLAQVVPLSSRSLGDIISAATQMAEATAAAAPPAPGLATLAAGAPRRTP